MSNNIDSTPQGEPYVYRVRFDIDGVVQDISTYTLEIKVVDKNTGVTLINRFVEDRTADNTAFIVTLTSLETQTTLGLGTFEVRNRVMSADQTITKTGCFDLLVGKSCF